MTDLNIGGRQDRTVTAFFDTQAAAQQAVDDLTAAGIPEGQIRLTQGTGITAVTETPVASEHKSIWAELKDLFLPDPDQHTYAEGLARGGHLVSVRVDADHYDRVLDILDADGAVDMDAREADWRASGWTGPDASGRTWDIPGMSAPAVVAPSATAEPATDAALASSSASVADAARLVPTRNEDAAAGRRDLAHGRSRLRSYIDDAADRGPTTLDLGQAVADPVDADTLPADARGGGAADVAAIKEHMDVLASDGTSVGTVDHLDGPDRIKLARSTSSDGEHHFIPVAWVDWVDVQVHLNRTVEAVRAGW